MVSMGFKRCVSTHSNQAVLSLKICLFIDGLDKYEGDHSDVVEILQGLAKSEDVKICLSSRP